MTASRNKKQSAESYNTVEHRPADVIDSTSETHIRERNRVFRECNEKLESPQNREDFEKADRNLKFAEKHILLRESMKAVEQLNLSLSGCLYENSHHKKNADINFIHYDIESDLLMTFSLGPEFESRKIGTSTSDISFYPWIFREGNHLKQSMISGQHAYLGVEVLQYDSVGDSEVLVVLFYETFRLFGLENGVSIGRPIHKGGNFYVVFRKDRLNDWRIVSKTMPNIEKSEERTCCAAWETGEIIEKCSVVKRVYQREYEALMNRVKRNARQALESGNLNRYDTSGISFRCALYGEGCPMLDN